MIVGVAEFALVLVMSVCLDLNDVVAVSKR